LFEQPPSKDGGHNVRRLPNVESLRQDLGSHKNMTT
jgi:hypothetical protein